MTLQATDLATGQEGDNARPQDPDTIARAGTQPTEATGADLPQDDPEAAELAAAIAAMEAEKGGQAAGGQQQEQKPPAPQAQPQPNQPPQAVRKAPGPVPYERFQSVAQRARTLEEENTFLKGAVDALKGQRPAATTEGTGPQQSAAAPAQPATTPAPDAPESVIAAAEARAMEAAERFDTGEISATELTRIQTAAAKEIAAAQVQMAMRSAPAASESVTDQMVMAAHVERLENENPVLREINQQQLQFLAETAHREAAAAGQPYRAGPRDTMRLREHVARLANAFAPHWGIQARAAQPAAPASNNQQPKPGPKPGLSPAAQQRLGKMDMAAGLPPDTARMGSTAATDQISEAALMAMSDDEIAALPATVRARVLTQ